VRAAVQWEALDAIFEGNCDDVMASTVLSSRIAVTAKILDLYEQKLGRNQKFQQWFASASQRRLTIHMPSISPRKVKHMDPITDSYGTASYYGGSNFFAHTPLLPSTTKDHLTSIGTKIIAVAGHIDFPVEGDNPVCTIGTESVLKNSNSLFKRTLGEQQPQQLETDT
jgi:hypothetical protein